MIETNTRTFYVLSTHHITMSTLICLQYIANKLNPVTALFYLPLGNMYKEEHGAMEEMLGGWKNFYQFYRSKHYVFDLDTSRLNKIRCAIQSELDIYLSLKTQTV